MLSIKDIFKSLYDISKTINCDVEYEEIKLICFGLLLPKTRNQKIILRLYNLYQLSFQNRYIQFKNQKEIREFKKYDSINFLDVILLEYPLAKKIKQKGTLLVYAAVLMTKYYGIIFRDFELIKENLETESTVDAIQYLKGIFFNYQLASKKRLQFDEVVETLRSHAKYFRSEDVLELYIFGSIVKKTNFPNSDIDILVKFSGTLECEKEIHMLALSKYISKLFNCHCDVVEENTISYDKKSDVLETAYRIF